MCVAAESLQKMCMQAAIDATRRALLRSTYAWIYVILETCADVMRRASRQLMRGAGSSMGEEVPGRGHEGLEAHATLIFMCM